MTSVDRDVSQQLMGHNETDSILRTFTPMTHLAEHACHAASVFRLTPLLILCWVTTSSDTSHAQTSTSDVQLNPVVVTGSRTEVDSFDLPYSIDAVNVDPARQGNLGVNVSEVLGRVPGIVVQNRQNYAQDLQISIRGFGARSAFGVRGVKLIADGIPATNPDGQGQAATFNLDTAERIEVLRGPFSTVYGNHAGGVVQLFSRDGKGSPQLKARVLGGSWGTSKYGIGLEGESSGVGYVVDASRFDTDGYRDHSKVRRDQAFTKLSLSPDADSRLTFVASSLHQPDTLDPQGINWNQYKRDPRSVDQAALAFNTRKRMAHLQGGVTYERDIGADTLFLSAYTGKRSVVQYQSIPQGAQANPRQAGGVIDFDRTFSGVGARWTARRHFDSGRLTVTTGIDHDRSRDDRRGWENFIGSTLGVRGDLRRDEIDTITSTDPYLQAVWASGPWQWSAGLRHSQVRFKVKDKYVFGINGDDSGSVSYRRTTPAFGVTYALNPTVNLYASAGAGFETPTLNELSYSADGGGFNFSLKPSRSKQFEAGIKAFVGDNTRIDAAIFHISTQDEIVVAGSSGGRTSFHNATETRRQGFELALDTALSDTITLRGALTYLDASYQTGFGSGDTAVKSGNKMPGIPKISLFAELAWQPINGVTVAAEAVHRGKVFVNDQNRAPAIVPGTPATAPAFTLANLRLTAEQTRGNWTLGQSLRVDNVFDRKHIGSVIVGNAQGRYFEPGPTRSWYAGVNATYSY